MEENKKSDKIIKILLVGAEKTGKTSITKRYSYITMPNSRYIYGTIGIDFGFKYIKMEDKNIKVHIWDSAGNIRFKSIIVNMLKNVDDVVLVCDLMNIDSIKYINEKWIKHVTSNKSNKIWILCNKLDLYEKCKDIEYKKNVDLELQKLQNINIANNDNIVNNDNNANNDNIYNIEIQKVSAQSNENISESMKKIFNSIYQEMKKDDLSDEFIIIEKEKEKETNSRKKRNWCW